MDRSRPCGALHTASTQQIGYMGNPCQFLDRLMAPQDHHLAADMDPALLRARTVDRHHHHHQRQPADLTNVEDRMLGTARTLDQVVDPHPTAMDLGLDLEAMDLDLEAMGLPRGAQARQRWAWRRDFVHRPPGARSRTPVRHTTRPNTRQASTMTGRMSGRSLNRPWPQFRTTT